MVILKSKIRLKMSRITLLLHVFIDPVIWFYGNLGAHFTVRASWKMNRARLYCIKRIVKPEMPYLKMIRPLSFTIPRI